MDGNVHFLVASRLGLLYGLCPTSSSKPAPFWTDGKHGLLPFRRQVPRKTNQRKVRSEPAWNVMLPLGGNRRFEAGRGNDGHCSYPVFRSGFQFDFGYSSVSLFVGISTDCLAQR